MDRIYFGVCFLGLVSGCIDIAPNAGVSTRPNSSAVLSTDSANEPERELVADAGPDQVLFSPASVAELRGATRSSGVIRSYRWSQVTGPSQAALGSPASARTPVGALKPGSYTFRFTVQDDFSGVASDTVTLTVKPTDTTCAVPVSDDPKLDGALTMYPTDAPLPHAYKMGHYLYRPEGYSKTPCRKWPLLIFLHGLGQVGPGTAATLPQILNASSPGAQIRDGTATKFARPFLQGLVLQPQAPGWSAPPVHDLIEYVKTKVRVDPDRIYVTGLSLGGGGAWAYGVTYPDEVAALVPISGTGLGLTTAERMADLPTWVFHAFRDTNGYNSLYPLGSRFRCAGGTPFECSTERLDLMVPYAANRVLEDYSADHGATKAASNMTASLTGKDSYGLPTEWVWTPGTEPKDTASRTVFTVQFKDGHDAWTEAYANSTMWDWLYRQKRPASAAPSLSASWVTASSIPTGVTTKISFRVTSRAAPGAKIAEVQADLRDLGGLPNQKLPLVKTLSSGAGAYDFEFVVPANVRTSVKSTKPLGITAIDDRGRRTVTDLIYTISP